MSLFRRPISCFFCHSPCPGHPNPRAFCCTACGCWNRYDENGGILSDEPAMHIESLNSHSFAKRASTSQSQLPSAYGNGPFCQACQTNQLILINLLSNYLPSSNDPEYSVRLEMFAQYRESLHQRYPPVCADCLPAVEEEIQRKNRMAKTKALGRWLDDSKGRERQRRVSQVGTEKDKFNFANLTWRIRGGLWALTFIVVALYNFAAALGYPCFRIANDIHPMLPGFTLISLLWTMWDPTYLSIQRARAQGRDVRVRGREMYMKIQFLAWCSRLMTASLRALVWCNPVWDWLHLTIPSSPRSRAYFASLLIVEILSFTISLYVIRIHQPPTVRLVQSDTHKSFRASSVAPDSSTRSVTPSARPASVEPESIAALSLSSKPIIASTNPMFGVPSLPSQPLTRDEDLMDWTPSSPQSGEKPAGDDIWLRPQRFFAPEKPTGLEGLFERVLLVDDKPMRTGPSLNLPASVRKHLGTWWWVYLAMLAPMICAGLYQSRKGMSKAYKHTLPLE